MSTQQSKFRLTFQSWSRAYSKPNSKKESTQKIKKRFKSDSRRFFFVAYKTITEDIKMSLWGKYKATRAIKTRCRGYEINHRRQQDKKVCCLLCTLPPFWTPWNGASLENYRQKVWKRQEMHWSSAFIPVNRWVPVLGSHLLMYWSSAFIPPVLKKSAFMEKPVTEEEDSTIYRSSVYGWGW